MERIYSKNANKKINKIKKISTFGQTESSGPIFGYFDINKKYQPIIIITHLINKTSSSSITNTEFFFKKTPLVIKLWNKIQKCKTRYIGSWHTHPTFDVSPSKKDWKTFYKINKQLKIAYTFFLIINSKQKIETIIVNTKKEKEVIYEITKF